MKTNSENFLTADDLDAIGEVAEGYIVGQSVQPDEKVAPGTKITLYVSKGEEEIILPNVIGSDYEEAVARLEELGFVCKKNEISQGNHRENEIVSMSPSYEKAYPPGKERSTARRITEKISQASRISIFLLVKPVIYSTERSCPLAPC